MNIDFKIHPTAKKLLFAFFAIALCNTARAEILGPMPPSNYPVTGEASPLRNSVHVYTFDNGTSYPTGVWSVTGNGQILSTSISGTTYTATIRWVSEGGFTIRFNNPTNYDLGKLEGSVLPGGSVDTALSPNQNYIYTMEPQVPVASTAGLTGGQKIEAVTYFDGLGRPKQNVAIRGGGNILGNNLINWKYTWALGSGSAPFFNQNGSTSENQRITGTDVHGNSTTLWRCGNDSSSNADGGWNTNYMSVDKTATYRYTVWVKRTVSHNGTTYHGTQNVNSLGGSAQSNPYFWSGDLPNLDQWYLLVGIIHPYTYNGGDSGVSGVYDALGNKVKDGAEFKWRSNTITSRFRSYLYYSTNTSVRQYFSDPILQRIDGNEASIADLVQGHSGNDIVTHIPYDTYGRQDKEYLPYAIHTNGGSYRNNALNATNSFYNTTKYDNTTNPYSEKHLEKSPLSRSLELGAPGNPWAVNKNSNTDKTIKSDHLANTVGEARRYKVTLSFSNNTYTPTLAADGHYAPGELRKTVTKDENWTSGTNRTTEEFTDKHGRVVLKRTHNNGDHDTYYVYDPYGNLTYVLPPKVVHDSNISSTELNELCYRYVYDNKNRLVEKKIPGKGWEYIIYDGLDRPIMTQDANLDAQNKWLFTKYDAFGRVAYTGLSNTTNSSRATLQNTVNGLSTFHVTKSGSYIWLAGTKIYYNNGGYPTGISEVHTINYYDDYTFDRSPLANPPSSINGQTVINYNNSGSTRKLTKGMPTGTKVRVLGSNHWITTVTYYDEKARAIYTASHNANLGTTDIVKSTLDFAGRTTTATTTHARGGSTLTIVDTYSYDHAGRLISQKQKINNQAEELLVQNTYDGLGQFTGKGVGGKTSQGRLQNVDYAYNVRGWLKQINDPSSLGSDLFSFKINYNTTGHGGNALYNGNIAETEWKTANDNALRWYRYGYDHLNRITSAIANSSNYNLGSVGYDKNGNIQSLTRNGWQNGSYVNMDVLDYDYHNSETSNRLYKVRDNGNDNYGFKDSSVDNQDYWYDANGNMTRDDNKGITAIAYNHLNLPTKVTVSGTNSGTIDYVYSADGTKLQKTVSTGATTDYASGYVYENNVLQFFSHPEGYVTPNTSGGYDYVYQYVDHLGNVRLSYADSDNNGSIDPSTEIISEKNYYPFGLQHKGYNNVINGTEHPYDYQGKELDESLNLNWHDFGARQYDAAIGRWMVVDPLAEETMQPYSAMNNNPIAMVDPTGMSADWVPKLNADGTTSYVAEAGDSAATLAEQYEIGEGLSKSEQLAAAEEITGTQGDTEIAEGTAVSGEQVASVTGSDVLKLDLTSKLATDQRVFDQYKFGNEYSNQQFELGQRSNDGFYTSEFYGNFGKTHKQVWDGTATMDVGGQTVPVNFSIPISYNDNGVYFGVKTRPFFLWNSFHRSPTVNSNAFGDVQRGVRNYYYPVSGEFGKGSENLIRMRIETRIGVPGARKKTPIRKPLKN